LAVLSAYDIFKSVRPGPVPQLYTFAGPRAGAPDFAASFNAAIAICNRVVNFMDFVPKVPLPAVYEHVGTETLVHSGFRPLDVTYAHHLTTLGFQAVNYPLPPGAQEAGIALVHPLN
jgi:predicted lipase